MCRRRGREARALPGSRRRRLSQLGPQPNPTGMQRGHMTSGGRATPFPLQGHPAPSCTDAVTKAGMSCSPLARFPLLSAQPRHYSERRSPGLILLFFSPARRGRPARGVFPGAEIMAPVFSLCLPQQLPTLPSCGCPCKTPAAISRNNRQNPSEQPQPSALRRERERNKRHTHRRVRQEKKYP